MSREVELYNALKAVTDHLAGVMGGPIMSKMVKFANGVEGIPTIARARALLAVAPVQPAPEQAPSGEVQRLKNQALDTVVTYSCQCADGEDGLVALIPVAKAIATLVDAALTHPATQEPAPESDGKVPWPVVDRYSGGASDEGLYGRVWLRLGDGPETVEYAPAPIVQEGRALPGTSQVLDTTRQAWVDPDTGEQRVTPRPAPHKRPPPFAADTEGGSHD